MDSTSRRQQFPPANCLSGIAVAASQCTSDAKSSRRRRSGFRRRKIKNINRLLYEEPVIDALCWLPRREIARGYALANRRSASLYSAHSHLLPYHCVASIEFVSYPEPTSDSSSSSHHHPCNKPRCLAARLLLPGSHRTSCYSSSTAVEEALSLVALAWRHEVWLNYGRKRIPAVEFFSPSPAASSSNASHRRRHSPVALVDEWIKLPSWVRFHYVQLLCAPDARLANFVQHNRAAFTGAVVNLATGARQYLPDGWRERGSLLQDEQQQGTSSAAARVATKWEFNCSSQRCLDRICAELMAVTDDFVRAAYDGCIKHYDFVTRSWKQCAWLGPDDRHAQPIVRAKCGSTGVGHAELYIQGMKRAVRVRWDEVNRRFFRPVFFHHGSEKARMKRDTENAEGERRGKEYRLMLKVMEAHANIWQEWNMA